MDMTLTPETQPWALPGLTRLTYTSPVDGTPDWALLLPPSPPDSPPDQPTGSPSVSPSLLDAAATTWIINIHGHGSTGDQLYTRQDIRQDWLPYFTHHRYGILTPNLRGNAWMSPAATADLHRLLQYLSATHGARRFIFASGSMGGTSNLIYASVHPQDVSAVIALCPATDLPGYHQWCGQRLDHPVIREIHQAIDQHYHHDPQAIASHSALANAGRLTMPLFVVHGDADVLIPAGQSQQLAQAMQGRPNFHYVQQPQGNHNAPLSCLRQGLDWVLQQLEEASPPRRT